MGWSFHALALASGAAEEELAAKRELLGRLGALSSWSRRCSYRVVARTALEELVRAMHAEETEAKRHEERKAALEAAVEGEDAVEEGQEEEERVVVTPSLLALAFQRLVNQDRREFLEHRQPETAVMEGAEQTQTLERQEREDDASADKEQQATEPAQTPARVYLLVDYPSSLAEIRALLLLGEVGAASQATDVPEKLPLLPLIDGVVLLADPPSVSAARGRTRSGSTNLQRKSDLSVDGIGPRVSMMETSVFQAANAVVRAFYEAAEMELVKTVETVASQKFAFKSWVASTTFSALPSAVETDARVNAALHSRYESVLSGVFPGSIAVSTVLFAITEAVATASSPPAKTLSAPRHSSSTDSSQFDGFIEHGDLVACRVARAQLCHEVLQADGSPCLLSQGNHRLDDLERAMWTRSDLPGVGNGGRKAMPKVPELSEPERSVRDTELATFYKSPRFSCGMVHLTRQLFQVEEMLGHTWRGKLQPRAFLESLPRAILPQRVASVLQQNSPDVYSSYYAPTDSLLLACLPKTAPGRMQTSFWVARDHVRHRPAFKDWRREQLASQEYLTPRTEAAAGACVPLSAGQLSSVATQTWSMYPADHSIVRVYQTPSGLAWLTVYHHGCVRIVAIWCGMQLVC